MQKKSCNKIKNPPLGQQRGNRFYLFRIMSCIKPFNNGKITLYLELIIMARLNYNQVEDNLINWLKEMVNQAGCSGAVVGLSGGIDSSVAAVLCKKAFGSEFLGVTMPCYSSEQDAADARVLAEKFSIDYITKDLGATYDKLLQILEPKNKKVDRNEARGRTNEKVNIAEANIKPRLRMTTLYYYAALNNYLVVGTDNWSELTVGYFTKHGDGGIDLAPLGRLVKTEVRELARHLEIPEEIIEKKPSAGLWEGQTDEEEMGFSYQQLDRYILTGKVDGDIKEKIENLVEKNKHKTEPIPKPAREKLF
jgi:NAD+ synthase